MFYLLPLHLEASSHDTAKQTNKTNSMQTGQPRLHTYIHTYIYIYINVYPEQKKSTRFGCRSLTFKNIHRCNVGQTTINNPKFHQTIPKWVVYGIVLPILYIFDYTYMCLISWPMHCHASQPFPFFDLGAEAMAQPVADANGSCPGTLKSVEIMVT